MRKLLRYLFRRPISFIAEKLSSAPREEDVFASLSKLLAALRNNKKRKGIIRSFDYTKDRFIIFSDQHKGIRDEADDFRDAEKNYLAALDYYDQQGFFFVSLGDCEELWKNLPEAVMKKNDACFAAEKKFLASDRYYRAFGNHDLIWQYLLQRNVFLKPVFGKKIKVYEGLILETTHSNKRFSIFLTHGHQGDLRGAGKPFSIWVVANIWTPIQRYLHVSINTPATSFELTDKHNIMMYDWSAKQDRLIFISGHTHKPVFASLDHYERLTKQLDKAKEISDHVSIGVLESEINQRKKEYAGKQQLRTMAKPSYFNSGCCCFEDGDITGIEIADGQMRLIKWDAKDGSPKRIVLEEAELSDLFEKL
jgi:predicted phosphodiesterase